MNWTLVEEDLPSKNGHYLVYLVKKGPILSYFENDSFGLGDDDYNVLAWQQFKPLCKPDVNCFFQNQLCTSPTPDHTDVDSSTLYRNLV